MATVQFSLSSVSAVSNQSTTLPIPDSAIVAQNALITTSGTSQQTSIAVAAPSTIRSFPNPDQQVWLVATDGACIVAFGANPTASATVGYYLPAAGVYPFRAGPVGEKGAVINAS